MSLTKIEQRNAIEQFLRIMFQPGDIIEIRGLGKNGAVSRLFRDFRLAAKTALTLSDADLNVYYSLNPCKPDAAILNPCDPDPWNLKLQKYQKVDDTRHFCLRSLKDRDIAEWNIALLDFDPTRPTGVAATQAELDAAVALAVKVKSALAAEGFPEPVVLCSGNGVHLLYKCDRSDVHTDYWKYALMFISRQFSSLAVKIDTAVFNPARISRLPFIMNRKGKSTAERPHRMATVLSYPEQCTALTVKTIRPFYIGLGPDHQPGQKRRQSELLIDEGGVLDLIAEYPDHLEFSGQTTEDGDSVWFALDSCPFKGAAHRGQETGKGKTCLVWSPENLGFSCFSDDCAGLGIGDLLKHLHAEAGYWPETQMWEWDEEWDDEDIAAVAHKWDGIDVVDNDSSRPVTAEAFAAIIENRERPVTAEVFAAIIEKRPRPVTPLRPDSR